MAAKCGQVVSTENRQADTDVMTKWHFLRSHWDCWKNVAASGLDHLWMWSGHKRILNSSHQCSQLVINHVVIWGLMCHDAPLPHTEEFKGRGRGSDFVLDFGVAGNVSSWKLLPLFVFRFYVACLHTFCCPHWILQWNEEVFLQNLLLTDKMLQQLVFRICSFTSGSIFQNSQNFLSLKSQTAHKVDASEWLLHHVYILSEHQNIVFIF